LTKRTKQSLSEDAALRAGVEQIASLAAEVKASHIVALDVRGLTTIADSFVLCSVGSEPHFKAVFRSVKEGMKDAGRKPLSAEGSMHGGWLVMDYGDVIFHVFREEARAFYDLDSLWGDAPRIDLKLDS